MPSLIRQSFSNTSVAACSWTVESTPSCGIMNMLSTASLVTPSGRKASMSIRAACERRGACDKIPPEPTNRFKLSMSTKEAPVAVWAKVSEIVRSCWMPFSPTAIDLCCSKANLNASRAIACSILSSFKV